ILSPANGSYWEREVLVNITAGENLSGAWAEISGDTRLNLTLRNTTAGWEARVNLSEGSYFLRVHATDLVNNTNVSLWHTFKVVREIETNSTTIAANTSAVVINTTNVLLNATAGGDASINISVRVAGFVIAPVDINRSTTLNRADRGVKYLEVEANSTNITRLRVVIYFNSSEVSPLDVSTLALFYWNGSLWVNTMDYINRTISDTLGGLHVYDAGRFYDSSTGRGYVYAEVNHTSIFGVGGRVRQVVSVAPLPGVYSPEAVVLASSIDLALASDFLAHLKERGIKLYVVSASNFSEYSARQYLIILGGHRAYEGVGDIVAGILSDEERRQVEEGMAFLKKRSVFREGQVVYIFAGRDRHATARAWREAYEQVAREIEYNWG
ncbi:MAG: hypothetical protein GXO66_05890, partial [Euryarchaeota archaeon]|nr:hypothetical protein [Euryarchaeota archaeon]